MVTVLARNHSKQLVSEPWLNREPNLFTRFIHSELILSLTKRQRIELHSVVFRVHRVKDSSEWFKQLTRAFVNDSLKDPARDESFVHESECAVYWFIKKNRLTLESHFSESNCYVLRALQEDMKSHAIICLAVQAFYLITFNSARSQKPLNCRKNWVNNSTKAPIIMRMCENFARSRPF